LLSPPNAELLYYIFMVSKENEIGFEEEKFEK